MPQPLRRRRTTTTAVVALLGAALLIPAATSHAGPTKGVYRPGKVRAHIALGPTHARAAQQRECENADVMPTAVNEREVRAAIVCLHNEIRADRSLPLLREDGRLRRAAVAHSEDMVSSRFFEHTTPAGVTMVDRIMAARYVPRNVGWSLGENLAWGTGELATPRNIMRAWMDSPGHRANVVKRAYREIGIGVVTGVPTSRSDGATYTADFGVLRR